MKIAVITSWFSESMGYSENFFPKALAALGHDVHVISSTAQVYYNSPMYEKTYRKHLGPAITQPCVKPLDGFTLQRLQPDVVQVVNLIDEPTTFDAALYARSVGKKIFTESHLHASVMRVNNQ